MFDFNPLDEEYDPIVQGNAVRRGEARKAREEEPPEEQEEGFGRPR